MSDAGLRGGEAFERLAAWGRARTVRRALDVAAGSDTALAITTAGGLSARVIGDPAALPFDNGVFDLVTCRLAAHRFPHAALVVREIQRVLASGGSFLVAEPLGLDEADVASGSGERAYRRPEWHAFLRAAGLTVMEEDTIGGEASPGSRVILIRAERD